MMNAARWLICSFAICGLTACEEDDAASNNDELDGSLSCEKGATKCIGDKKATCQEDGSWLAEACDEGLTCVDGSCKAASGDCPLNEKRCQENAVIVCRESGWSAPEPCDVGQSCLNGACLPQTCIPDTPVCLNGNTLVCSKNGLGYDPAEGIDACNSDLTLVHEDLPEAVLGEEYNYSFTVRGGTTPYRFDLTQGALPAGLTLSESGVLSGVPQSTGSFAFKIAVTDADRFTEEALFTLLVQSEATTGFTITSTALDEAEAGEEYLYQLTAKGGKTPYAWSKIEGDLPPGLTLSSDGALMGTPTAHGDYAFKVRAFDADTPPSYADADLSLTVNIAPLVVTGSKSLNIASFTAVLLPVLIEYIPYSAELEAKGGVEPYHWSMGQFNSIAAAALALLGMGSGVGLPSGLTLQDNGQISGYVTDLNSAFSISLSSLSVSGYIFQAQVCDSQPEPACANGVFLIPTTELSLGGNSGNGGSSGGDNGSSGGDNGFDLGDLFGGLFGGGSSGGDNGSSGGDNGSSGSDSGFDLGDILGGLFGGGSSGDNGGSSSDDGGFDLGDILGGLFGGGSSGDNGGSSSGDSGSGSDEDDDDSGNSLSSLLEALFGGGAN